MKHKFNSLKILCCIMFLFAINPIVAHAQRFGEIEGKVQTEEGKPLRGVNVYLVGTNRGSVTDRDGSFRIVHIPVGEYKIVAEFIGRERQSQSIAVKQGQALMINFTLPTKSLIMPGVVVSASQTGDLTESLSTLSPTVIRRKPVRVTGELIRQVPGVDAVRRGPVGLDPVVRGLRETEVGTYIDGSRMFPAGPLRMDSPISHIDPNAIQEIHVMKGPYALTWGAGNLSTIKVETAKIPPPSGNPFNGTVTSGFHSNLNAADVSGSVLGVLRKFSYWASGTWRKGNDYQPGNSDSNVPADFKSREIRGKIGFEPVPKSQLSLSGGYQRQDDMDYPGNLLNADFFNASNFSVRWGLNRDSGLLSSVDISGYYNFVSHGMDNDDKPTAEPGTFPNGNPRPPLDIEVDSRIRVIGGRAAASLTTTHAWNWQMGADIYTANRDATRTLARRDNGALLFTDLMWPDATITDLGVFTHATKLLGSGLKLSGTLRLDFVHAKADTASDFFLENISTSLDDSESNISAAITASKALAEHWLITLGAGSAVRTADATERYSDRIPASKAQTTAEFVGNPNLNSERSTQVDLWLDVHYPRFSLSTNAFVRKMDSYITLEPTSLPKRLPLSPETVFQYINGRATFAGFEASATYRLSQVLSSTFEMEYLWGQDETLDEPVLGVSPFRVDGSLRFDSRNKRFFVEGNLHAVTKQTRVASLRGESPTNGYVTADIIAGGNLWQSVELRAGLMNLTDKLYVNHLNAKNPFTDQQVPEPGRVFFTNLSYAF